MKFLGVLSGLCALTVGSSALDREAFTFTNYDLQARIEPEQQRLGVRGKVTLRNDSNSPQRNLVLQISSSLDWRSIQLDGKPVQFVSQPYTSDIDHTGALSEAILILLNDVPPKGTLELEIGYEGVIPLDVTRLTRIGVPEDRARHSDWDQIDKTFTAVRGIGYVAWYPVATEAASLSEGNRVEETVGRWKAREEQAVVKLRFSLQGEGTSASLLRCNGQTGGEQGYEQMGRGYKAWSDCSFQPLRNTVPLFLAGDYEGLDKPPVNISYFATHKSAAENYALAAQMALPLVTEWFGAAKGRPEVRAQVVELSDPHAAPYETGSVLLTPLNNDLALAQLTSIHQLTHAAFPSPRPWIYEGLAHFAQALYREGEGGRLAALDFMGLHGTLVAQAEKALAEKKDQNDAARNSLINTSMEEFYRSKAMYVWWMLRDMIGDSALKKALAAYRPDADNGPSYVQQLIGSQTQRDLEWFFDDWVYRDRGLPDFRVESVYPRATLRNFYIVTVTVENLGDAGAEVPVTLKMEQGEVATRLVVRGKSKATTRLQAASPPVEVVVNDGSVPESDMSNNTYKIEVTEKEH
jgi:hypothetical protein